MSRWNVKQQTWHALFFVSCFVFSRTFLGGFGWIVSMTLDKSFHQSYMGVSENRGTPKWMVYNGKPMENPIKRDDLEENPLFLETSICVFNCLSPFLCINLFRFFFLSPGGTGQLGLGRCSDAEEAPVAVQMSNLTWRCDVYIYIFIYRHHYIPTLWCHVFIVCRNILYFSKIKVM